MRADGSDLGVAAHSLSLAAASRVDAEEKAGGSDLDDAATLDAAAALDDVVAAALDAAAAPDPDGTQTPTESPYGLFDQQPPRW